MIRPFTTISLAALSLSLAAEARAQTQPDNRDDIIVLSAEGPTISLCECL